MTDTPADDDEQGEQDEQADELLLALARRAREQPSVWEAVVRGERPVDEVAAREQVDVDRARAYFRPFDAGEIKAIVDGVLASSGQAEPRSTNVVPLRSPESRKPTAGLWIVGATLLALAAALALWWAWPRPELGTGGQGIATREPLPEYGLEVGGWLKTLRDDAPTAPSRFRYRTDTAFEWILRPEVSPSPSPDPDLDLGVAVRAFVLDANGVGRSLEIGKLVQIAKTGSIRIVGTIGQLDLAPGRYTVVLALGRPDALPELAEALAEPTGEVAWQIVRIDLEIESPASDG